MTTALLVARWVHLVAAATWLGGLIVLGPLVVALRRAGAEREQLQAAARMFGNVSWAALCVAVASGLLQVVWLQLPWTYDRLQIKMAIVGLAALLAGVHQVTARRSSPAVRGIFQLAIIVVSLAIYAVAVWL